MTTEALCKRIGRDGLESVILWVKYLLDVQKDTMVKCEYDVSQIEQAKAKYLDKTLMDLRSVLNGDRKGNPPVSTGVSNGRA